MEKEEKPDIPALIHGLRNMDLDALGEYICEVYGEDDNTQEETEDPKEDTR